MSRPYFSEMLYQQRCALGLTIEQASRVLKLKPRALKAFEDGNFENIPKSGYAQGMISSYARYLGLDPQEVVSHYQRDLADYTHAVATGGYAPSSPAHSTATLHGVSSMLQRPADQTNPGSLETVSPARHRSDTMQSRYGAGTQGGYGQGYGAPQQGGGYGQPLGYGQQAGYSQQGGYGQQGGYSRQPSHAYGNEASGYPQGRPYTSRQPYDQGVDPRNARGTYRRPQEGGRYSRSVSPEDTIVSRRYEPERYTDDLYYDEASPYEAASTHTGRRSSRNIASTDRPRVRRQPASAQRRGGGRRRPPEPPKSGIAGVIQWFTSDQRRLFVLIGAIVVVLIMLVIMFSVSSCVAGPVNETKSVSVTTAVPATSQATTKAATSSKTTASTASAATTSATTPAAVTATNVTVKVADGEVTWLEIVNDGTSAVAEQVTGPWEQTYTVTKSMNVQVNNITAVSVTKNGEQVQFDSRTSGVGSVTIQGTDPAAATAAATTAASDGESLDAEGSSY